MKTAGGHNENFTDKGSRIEKILEHKSEELLAYEMLSSNTKLDGLIPKFYGSYINKHDETVIIMENLLKYFDTNASILDLKLMTRKFNNKVVGSAYGKNGFRVGGLIKNKKTTKGIGYKEDLFTFKKFAEINLQFLIDHLTDINKVFHSELIPDIMYQLDNICAKIEFEPIYNSSILIITDYKRVGCYIIDFGHYGVKSYGEGIDPIEAIKVIGKYYEYLAMNDDGIN